MFTNVASQFYGDWMGVAQQNPEYSIMSLGGRIRL